MPDADTPAAPAVDEAARAYIDALAPDPRALFDRVHHLVGEEAPTASVTIAYDMPTYVVGDQRLHVAAWSHGLSLYGWREADAATILARHPKLSSGRGTLRLTYAAADDVSDDELRRLVRGALDPAR